MYPVGVSHCSPRCNFCSIPEAAVSPLLRLCSAQAGASRVPRSSGKRQGVAAPGRGPCGTDVTNTKCKAAGLPPGPTLETTPMPTPETWKTSPLSWGCHQFHISKLQRGNIHAGPAPLASGPLKSCPLPASCFHPWLQPPNAVTLPTRSSRSIPGDPSSPVSCCSPTAHSASESQKCATLKPSKRGQDGRRNKRKTQRAKRGFSVIVGSGDRGALWLCPDG